MEIDTCPFCGQRPSITVDQTEISQEIGEPEFRARIDCLNTACSVKPFLGPTIFTDVKISRHAETTRDAAVSLWNKRPDIST